MGFIMRSPRVITHPYILTLVEEEAVTVSQGFMEQLQSRNDQRVSYEVNHHEQRD